MVEGAKVLLMVSGGPTLGQAAAEELAATKAKTTQEKADRLEAQSARSDARRKRQAERDGSDLIEARSSLQSDSGRSNW